MQVATLGSKTWDWGLVLTGLPLCVATRAANIFPLSRLANLRRKLPLPHNLQVRCRVCAPERAQRLCHAEASQHFMGRLCGCTDRACLRRPSQEPASPHVILTQGGKLASIGVPPHRPGEER